VQLPEFWHAIHFPLKLIVLLRAVNHSEEAGPASQDDISVTAESQRRWNTVP